MKGVYIIMSNIADKFEELGVIPVVVLNDAKDALPLAKEGITTFIMLVMVLRV